MATAPTVAWTLVMNKGGSPPTNWSGTGGVPTTVNVPIYNPTGTTAQKNLDLRWLYLAANVSGLVNNFFNGSVTLGSFNITNCTGLTGVAVGQLVGGIGMPSYSSISAISGTTVTFTNGGGFGTAGIPTPAYATSAGNTYNAVDEWPTGYLVATVSPATGVTISDWNADGTSNVNTIGSGTMVANLAGQADGNFQMTFQTPGTYTVSCNYVSNDSNFSNATVGSNITVTVS